MNINDKISVSKLASRLEDAFDTLRRLPSSHVQTRLVSWPDVVQNSCTLFAKYPKRIPPSPQAIDQCEDMLFHLFKAPLEDRRLLWARAGTIPWRILCHEYGVSHMTLRKRHAHALKDLALRIENEV